MNFRRILVVFALIAAVFGISKNDALAYDPSCTTSPGGNVGVSTSLGCIPVEADKFVAWLLPFVFGIAGGISFLLMVYGFIIMTTSSGDPKAIQGAQETITSAITGLLICIFALFILRLIAVDILKIPGIN